MTPAPAVARIAVSVVLPMHNEEASLLELHRRLSDVLDALGEPCELVAVSDGSTDGTNALLRELAGRDPRMRAFHLSRNAGQWAAIASGLRCSRGDYVVIMDADLQHAPEDLPAMLAKARTGYDLVSGSRGRRSESIFGRRIPSGIANALLRAATGCPVRDMGGYQCLRGDVARRLRLRAGQHRLMPALVHLMGGRVGEVPVAAPPRFAGESHYGVARALDVIFDIVMLWFQSSSQARPLYLFGRFSLAAFLAAAATMTWVVYEKFALGEPMGARPPFFLALAAFAASFGLLGMGMMLELASDALPRLTDHQRYIVRTLGADAEAPGEAADLALPEHAASEASTDRAADALPRPSSP